MTTKQQYITQARKDNPKPLHLNANGTLIELSDDEYEASLAAWAEMRIQQDEVEAERQASEAAAASARAKLQKLGLTDDEIAALTGG